MRFHQLSRLLLPVGVGAFSALGFAPLSVPLALIASIAWLFHRLMQTQSVRGAFILSYLWALGHYVAGLYWIGNSTLVDAAMWGWAYPLAAFVLPALFALYQGVAGALAVWLGRIFPQSMIIILMLLFIAAEWVRAHLFTGFPWNMAGVTWISLPWIAQNADYMGMMGLGIVTYLCAGAAARWREATSLIAISIMLIIMAGYGAAVQKPTRFDEDTNVRIVQPNIAQQNKWADGHLYANSVAPLAASDEPPPAPKTHNIVIWPETAQAKPIWLDPDFNTLYRATFRDWPRDTVVYTGLLNTDPGHLSNALIAADRDGRIMWTQDKHHLVPFGEYMPFDDVTGIGPIIGMESMIKGQPPRTMADGVIPLICYEIIFADLARKAYTTNSRMIITVTDDSWFGVSPGPYQHLTQARFRAIETGLPVLRSANTGISAVIDPYGRVIKHSALNEYAALNSDLPLKRWEKPLYVVLGDVFSALFAVLASALIFIKRFC